MTGALLYYVAKGDVQGMTETTITAKDIEFAFRLACMKGYNNVFAQLLSIVDAAGRSIPSCAYDAAVAYDRLEMLLMLMNRLDEEMKDTFIKNMLRDSVAKGAADIFKFFYEMSDSDFDSDAENALYSACKKGYLDIAVFLSEEAGDYYEELKLNALAYAVRGGHYDIVRYLCQELICLFDNPAVTLPAQKLRGSPKPILYEAIEADSLPIVRFLVEILKQDVNITDEDGRTPLHIAVMCKSNEIARRNCSPYSHQCCNSINILKYLVEVADADVTKRTSNGLTAFDYAFRNLTCFAVLCYALPRLECDSPAKFAITGDLLSLKTLLAQNPDIIDQFYYCGRNLLHYACLGGRLDVVQFLIENHGMDPDVDDEYDCSCLQIAATMEQYDMLSYICSKTECLFPTVIINEMFHSRSLLCYIHSEDNENRMVPESYGRKVLMSACIEGRLDLVQYFFGRISVDEKYVTIAKEHAHFGNKSNIIKYLIGIGLSSDEKEICADIWYDSYLHFAVYERDLTGLQNILETGNVDIDKPGKCGWTALHCSCYLGRVEETKLLLFHGASVFVSDALGRTALHMISSCRASDSNVVIELYKLILNHFLHCGVTLRKHVLNRWLGSTG